MEPNKDQESQETRFVSIDGLAVPATLLLPAYKPQGCAVLIHGITENRHETSGFYAHLAIRLADQGFASLRFDLRGHGDSPVQYEALTLTNAISDISAAVSFVNDRIGLDSVHLLGTSFGGGLATLYAAMYGENLDTLVLLCPNLDYRRNWVEKDDYWYEGQLTMDAVKKLNNEGTLSHGDFRIGRELLHELLHIRPFRYMASIPCPSLIIHGTADSVVPHDLSVQYYKCNDRSDLLLIEGADHGFAIPGDDEFTDPVTISNQDKVFTAVSNWLTQYNKQR